MHPDTRNVAVSMRAFGLAALSRAAYDITFQTNLHRYADAMAISQAGHGAELILKSRIAEEHPLLLFTTLPRSTAAEDQLTFSELFSYGRTVQFSELPELLWAATGIRMDRVEQYQAFGRLRNGVVHFALPSRAQWHDDTLRFLFEVMEPLTQRFWNESIATHSGLWDEVTLDGHLEARIRDAGVVVTKELAAALTMEALEALHERQRSC